MERRDDGGRGGAGRAKRTFSLMYVMSPSTSFFLSLERFCLLSRLRSYTSAACPTLSVTSESTRTRY